MMLFTVHADHGSAWVRTAVFTVKLCQMCNIFHLIMSLALVPEPLYKISTKKEMGLCHVICKSLYYTNLHQYLSLSLT